MPRATLLWPLQGPRDLRIPLAWALRCPHITLVVVDGRGIEGPIASELRHPAVARPMNSFGAGPNEVLVLTSA